MGHYLENTQCIERVLKQKFGEPIRLPDSFVVMNGDTTIEVSLDRDNSRFSTSILYSHIDPVLEEPLICLVLNDLNHELGIGTFYYHGEVITYQLTNILCNGNLDAEYVGTSLTIVQNAFNYFMQRYKAILLSIK